MFAGFFCWEKSSTQKVPKFGTVSVTLKLTAKVPENRPGPKRKVVFQPSIFRGELLVSKRVPVTLKQTAKAPETLGSDSSFLLGPFGLPGRCELLVFGDVYGDARTCSQEGFHILGRLPRPPKFANYLGGIFGWVRKLLG